MRARRFTAGTVEDALRKVRAALGGSAVILDTRRVERRRLFGLAPASRVEIVAAAGVRLRRDASHPASSDRLATVVREMQDLRGLVHDLLRRDGPAATADPPAVAAARARLAAIQTPAAIADRLCLLLRANLAADAPAEAGRAKLLAYVESLLPVAGPVAVGERRREGAGPRRARRVALVGPTGVGKTTTAAKLAAAIALRAGARVGLLTSDTYRVAAVEQLARYADILRVPFATVETPDAVRAATTDAAVEVWVLDTAGRPPRDAGRLTELTALLEAFGPDETHLVLAATTGAAAQTTAWREFARVKPTRCLLTKLDEAESLGGLLEVTTGSGLPVSYLGTGQEVPDDLEVAERGRLARLVLAESPLVERTRASA